MKAHWREIIKAYKNATLEYGPEIGLCYMLASLTWPDMAPGARRTLIAALRKEAKAKHLIFRADYLWNSDRKRLRWCREQLAKARGK